MSELNKPQIGRVTRTGTYLTETGVESGTVTYEVTGKNLLDHLQEQGYMPDDDPNHISDWYDLTVSGIGAVRCTLDAYDGDSVNVFAFDKHMACEWSARFAAGTPDAVIIGTLEAAEWQLAGKRGGPVTPAQASNAR